MSTPRVSVLLPVYGDEPHLSRALESVADQTYDSYEVVAVTREIPASAERALRSTDLPIVRLRQTGDGGLAAALNAGLRQCEGEFVARFDADDVMRPERLEKQVAFLDEEPTIGVVGGGYEKLDAEGATLGTYCPPRRDTAIRWQMLTRCAFAHPTVTVRRSVLSTLDPVYRPKFDSAEDYDLWSRLLPETRFANIGEPLIGYRVEGDRKSDREKMTQKRHTITIAHRTIQRMCTDVRLTEEEVGEIISLLYYGESDVPDRRKAVSRYLGLLRTYERQLGEGPLWRPRASASVRAARAILRPPIEIGGLPVLFQLLTIHPLYPLLLARFLFYNRVLDS